jgi:hypothetical protein
MPVGRRVEAADEIHQRRLAGAGRADDRHHLALFDLEVDAFQRLDFHLAGVVDLADVAIRMISSFVAIAGLLFVAQRRGGIDRRRAPRGEVAGQRGR